MPRTVPSGLLNSPSRCVGCLVVLNDGTRYAVTDARVTFTYDGDTYTPVSNVDVSIISQEAGTTVDNLEITTILNDAEAYIKSFDLVGLRFEDSRWTLFEIDYENPSNGAMILASYRCAYTTIKDTEIVIELLGLISFLKQTTGRSLCNSCDVLKTFDIRCDPTQTLRTLYTDSLTVGAIQSLFALDFFGSSRASQFYNAGDILWTSGENNGLPTQIKYHTVIVPAAYNSGLTYSSGAYVTSGGHTYYSLVGSNVGHSPASSPTYWKQVTGNPSRVARILLRVPTDLSVAVGDTASVCRGCDRRVATCKSIPNSANPSTTNVENYKGFVLPDPDKLQTVVIN